MAILGLKNAVAMWTPSVGVTIPICDANIWRHQNDENSVVTATVWTSFNKQYTFHQTIRAASSFVSSGAVSMTTCVVVYLLLYWGIAGTFSTCWLSIGTWQSKEVIFIPKLAMLTWRIYCELLNIEWLALKMRVCYGISIDLLVMSSYKTFLGYDMSDWSQTCEESGYIVLEYCWSFFFNL